MLTFQDIFKSDFLSSVDSISLVDIALALVLSFALGLFIFFVYKKTYMGVMYSSSFGVTLVALTMITTVVILAVTSNVVLSLGMVGALSIVRFRAAIKEPLEIAFLFWAIAVGIVLAAGLIVLAVIGSAVIGLILIVFVNRRSWLDPYIVVLRCDGAESEREAADDGEDWGLYLAVEGVEESFLLRNYGTDYGELYKPDSMEMGGGRGNGGGFDMDQFQERFENDEFSLPEGTDVPGEGEFSPPEGEEMPAEGGFDRGEGGFGGRGGMGGGMMGGSSDVLLVYTDDDYDSYANIFDNAKTDVSNADKDRLIDALQALGEGGDVSDCVDIESVISYFVAHNFVCNFDSYTGSMIHNYYLYEDGGLLSMLPWDYNLAFGGFMGSSDAEALVNWSIDDPTSDGDTESRPMLAWIFESEEYTELYHAAFAEFIESVFTSGEFERLFDETVELISPYVERDPTKFCTYEEFELGAETLREFCLLRAESIGYQLAGEDVTVDASGLDISAMGSMNNTAGGGGKGFRG